ncbi:NAD(P)-binding protein [Thozetella sp. PMI_491]|nr:NAD(P)-binding protein [Thozetella sp. PMI_491]
MARRSSGGTRHGVVDMADSAVKAQFDTNVFALLRITRAVLPSLRSQGSGLIMNLSSIGGLHGYPSNGIYCATKFAVEGITESLAAEIEPFGLKATIVEPGYFRTAFLANPASGANVAPSLVAYKGTVAHEARKAFELYNGKQPGNPKEGAARIWEYAAGEGLFKGKKQLLRLPLGSDTGALMKQFSADLAETATYYEDIWNSTDFRD